VLEILYNLWGQEPSWNRLVVPAREATQSGGIGSLESILGLLQSLKFGLWPARLHSLADLIPWNHFLDSLKVRARLTDVGRGGGRC
jgi:hypothetical protein